ncbi:MAG: hypothetical protein NVS1B7_5310 [Candidatus Saccharimonadales bacterium]
MDNIKPNKTPRNRPNNAIDGFILPGKASQPRHSSNFVVKNNKPTIAGQNSVSRLNNFKTSDGFHSVGQPRLQTNGRNSIQPALGRKPRRDGKGRIDMSLPPAAARSSFKKRYLGKKIIRSTASIVILFVLIFGYVAGNGLWKARHVFKGGAANAAALQANIDPAKLKGEGDGRVNILLLGIGGVGHDGPDLTDTMLIASVDPINHKASLLSIPRDLWIKMPANKFIGGYQKINAAYEAGKYDYLNKEQEGNSNTAAVKAGFASVDKVLKQVLGIPIHYNVVVDFKAFIQGINTVGGVSVNVPEQLYDPTIAWENNNNPVIAKAGLQTFDGPKALLYARSRETTSDFARSQRQRSILLALKDKVLSAGTISNPSKLTGLVNAFGDNVVTDLNINEVSRLYDVGKQISNTDVVSVGLADPPNHYVTTGTQQGLSIVQPTAGLFNYSEIQNFIRNTLKDGYIANENAKILILNGTPTTGLATSRAAELKSYGYNVQGVGTTPTSNYQKTTLIDLTKGVKKYTKRYLEQRLNVTSDDKLPDTSINPGDADFVIILGSNESIRT